MQKLHAQFNARNKTIARGEHAQNKTTMRRVFCSLSFYLTHVRGSVPCTRQIQFRNMPPKVCAVCILERSS